MIASGRVAHGANGIALDVTDRATVDQAIAHHRPRAVVHLAASSFVPAAENAVEATFQVNLMGTMHLASALLKHAPDCRFVFVSSSEVYGGSFRGDSPLDESALLEPLNFYASSKAAADLLMGQLARKGLLVARFRPFNHIGPGQAARFVVASFAGQIAAAEAGHQPPIISTGNLDSVRDFLDVRDVVRAYATAAIAPEPLPPGTILNLASGVPRQIGDVLRRMMAMATIPLQWQQRQSLLRETDVPFAVGDASRAQQLLQWSPVIPFSSTLEAILEDARAEIRSVAGRSTVTPQ